MAAKKKATKAEMRVRIAKDVIAQLKAKRIKAVAGTYGTVRFTAKQEARLYDSAEPVDVKETLSGKRCEACALGSMFIVAVDRHNDLRLPGENLACVLDRDDECDYLSRFFSREQLDMVESAFEMDTLGDSNPSDEVCLSFAHLNRAHDRMIAIMQNIVANGGKFRPPKPVGDVRPDHHEHRW